MKEYKIVYCGGEGEIVEKKSRFIATVKPVDSEEEASAFIAEEILGCQPSLLCVYNRKKC